MDLFEYNRSLQGGKEAPLAARMRPSCLEDFVGQEHIVGKGKLLYRAIQSDRLSSVIFYGPPGTGKTTLAKIIANTTKSKFCQINATTAGIKEIKETVEDAKAELGMYGKKTILFIDEIHRLDRAVEEILYPAMEDYALDIIIGKGPSARSIRIDLPKFTLIGATTRAGQMTSPLRDRFGVMLRLELYSPEELCGIVERSAGILNVPCEHEGAFEIARRSRGTPRIANRLLRRVRDFAQVIGTGTIDRKSADIALRALEIDELGLDNVDRRMLKSIIQNYGGGPVGLDTLAATIGEEAITLEDVYEPYLMQIGFLSRTPRGRCVTLQAYRHLNLEPADGQQML